MPALRILSLKAAIALAIKLGIALLFLLALLLKLPVFPRLPTISTSAIEISGATGTGGAFIIGDTVTATWDNSSNGDNNPGIATVTFDFSEFGGGSTVAATSASDIWTATFQIVAGTIEEMGLNVSVTANSVDGPVTKVDDADATLDNVSPLVSGITLTGTPGITAPAVTYRVTFSENVNDISTDDFSLTKSGTANGTIDSVSVATGTSVDVLVNTVSGVGTLRLDLLGSTDVVDDAGNAVDTAFIAGASHTVDTRTVPDAPIIGNATGGDGKARVNFTAPINDGGFPITEYTVTSVPGGIIVNGASSPIEVTGLTNNVAYTFVVKARNSLGAGANSASSNSVTPLDSDSDGDGIVDIQEIAQGSNPNDPDSSLRAVASEYCHDWNGYNSKLTQIAEYRNAGSASIGLKLELRTSEGVLKSTNFLTLLPAEQHDIIVNQLGGFLENSYGTLCASILSGPVGALDTTYVTYELSETSFNYAFAVPYAVSRSGLQFLGYNHIFPTLNASELNNPRYGFVQISNEEQTSKSGDLVFYDPEGTEVRRTAVTIPPLGRIDVATHTVGINTVGLIKWQPEDMGAIFRVILSRYYFNSVDKLMAAASIPAKIGNGAEAVTAFDTTSKLSVIELSNTTNSPVLVPVSIYVGGVLQNPQGSVTTTVTVKPLGTTHVVLNEYVANGIGNVQIDPAVASSIIAEYFEYGLNNNQTLKMVTNTAMKVPVGTALRGSYNNFLGGCTLKLANSVSTDETVALTMKRYTGESISVASPRTVPANGLLEVDICSNDTQSAYGELLVVPTNVERVVGEVVRKNVGGGGEFRVGLGER